MPEVAKDAGKKVLIAILALSPPAVAYLTGMLDQHPVLRAAAIALYETLLLGGGLARKVYKGLSERWADRITSRIDELTLRLTARFGVFYKRYVLAANSHMEQLGLATRSEFALHLADIYITLSLDHPNSLQTLSSNPIDYRAQTVRSADANVWDWIREARKYGAVLVITGPPGSGKTTILKHVAVKVVQAGRREMRRHGLKHGMLPVIIPLRDFKAEFSESTASLLLPELIRKSFPSIGQKEPPRWVESKLSKNLFLVMFDGLDEVASGKIRKNVSAWIEQQRALYPEVAFVVTSRPFGYVAAPLDSATVVQVRPFSEDEVRQFVGRWYGATAIRMFGDDSDAAQLYAEQHSGALLTEITRAADVLDLAVNPLLLTMVCNVHEYRGALPLTRLALYREICEVLLARRHQARGITQRLTGEQKQSVLQMLALAMMKNEIREVTIDSATKIIRKQLRRITTDLDAAAYLKDIEESSGLLVEREFGAYGFAHLSFQEYLAATQLAVTSDIRTLLSEIHNSWWRETILLYAAQADATEIVERCIEPPTDLHMLSLAVSCTDNSREISPETRRKLSSLRGGDFRNSKEKRRAAGAVELFKRLRSFTRIDEDTYVSRSPITWAEYQVFLDEKESNSLLPDHWSEGVYPEGVQMEAAVGMRGRDAQYFCSWLQSVYSDGWQYDLIESPTLVRHLHDEHTLEARENVKATFATQTVELSTDNTPEYPIGSVYEVSLHHVVLDDELYAEAQQSVDRQLHLDFEFVGSRVAADSPIDRSGLDDDGIITPELLSGVLSSVGSIPTSEIWVRLQEFAITAFPIRCLDLDDTAGLADSVHERAVEFHSSMSEHPAYSKLAANLVALTDIVVRGVEICLKRSTTPMNRVSNCREERFTVRLACIAGFTISEALITFAFSGFSLFQGNPSDDSFIGLPLSFARLHRDMAILESRLDGNVDAWEGLYVGRRR